MSFLQALEIQPESIAVPFQYLNAIPVPVAEHKHCPVKRVKFEAAFYNGSESVDILPHICLTTSEKHALTGEAQHDRLSAASSTAIFSAGYLLSAAIRIPARSMRSSPCPPFS